VKTFVPVSNVGAENFQPLQSYRGITIKHKNLWDGNVFLLILTENAGFSPAFIYEAEGFV